MNATSTYTSAQAAPPQPSALPALLAIAGAVLALHVLNNGQYGFHRDELATVIDAKHMAWGFVAYPPFTPLMGHIEHALFGDSLRGYRFFGAVAQAIVIVLSGLMARRMGGGRTAQIIVASAVAISPVSLASGGLYQYVTYDFMWWVVVAYFCVCLISSEDPRWWIAVGAAIGMGVNTKYTMGFFAISLAVGLLFTPLRRHLRSPWLWAGVALSLLIFLPNLIWQVHNHFISLEFLKHIHARDVRIGRTKSFLPEQLFVATNIVTVPLWIAGLVWLIRTHIRKDHGRFRLLAWMYLITMAMFVVAKGRGYYTAPMYPMLMAAGAVSLESALATRSSTFRRVAIASVAVALLAGFLLSSIFVIPLAPVNSRLWNAAIKFNGDFREEIGWPELVSTVSQVRDSLPAEQQKTVGIIAANYGEAGAIELYGAAYHLPTPISGVNSYWARGYPSPPPRPLIVLGLSQKFRDESFTNCRLAGHITNPYNVRNEETEDHPDIFVCDGLKQPWPEFWKDFRYFG